MPLRPLADGPDRPAVWRHHGNARPARNRGFFQADLPDRQERAACASDSPRDLRELFLGERTISPPRSPELRPFATSRVGVRDETTTEARLRRAIAEEGYGAEVVGLRDPRGGVGRSGVRTRSTPISATGRCSSACFGAAPHPSGLSSASQLVHARALWHRHEAGRCRSAPLVDRTLSDFYATPEFMALLGKYFREASARHSGANPGAVDSRVSGP